MIKIGPAKGSQVLHRPLMQNIAKMCQRFLRARCMYLRTSRAIQRNYGPIVLLLIFEF